MHVCRLDGVDGADRLRIDGVEGILGDIKAALVPQWYKNALPRNPKTAVGRNVSTPADRRHGDGWCTRGYVIVLASSFWMCLRASAFVPPAQVLASHLFALTLHTCVRPLLPPSRQSVKSSTVWGGVVCDGHYARR